VLAHSIAKIESQEQVGTIGPRGVDAAVHAGPSQWMTVHEAASYLKVKPRTLLLWARKKQIRSYTLCGTQRRRWRFLKADLDSRLLAQDVGVVCCTAPSVFCAKGDEK
jgi:excisionase family DNA binding protein